MQEVGVCGSRGMWGGLHLLGEVARAIQRVSGGPLDQGFLSIEEQQLQRQVGDSALCRRSQWGGGVSAAEMYSDN